MDLSNLGNGINAIEFDDEDEKKDKVKKEKKKKKDDAEDEINGGNAKLIHIRVQQRNGRKCITTVQGLDSQLDLKKILKAIKKAECCNGTVVEDEEMGEVLQFQGDQRDAVAKFLTENEIVDAAHVKKHGAG
jgi:translation initiation factor 1